MQERLNWAVSKTAVPVTPVPWVRIPPPPPEKESELVSGFFSGLPIGSGFEPVFCVSKMGSQARPAAQEFTPSTGRSGIASLNERHPTPSARERVRACLGLFLWTADRQWIRTHSSPEGADSKTTSTRTRALQGTGSMRGRRIDHREIIPLCAISAQALRHSTRSARSSFDPVFDSEGFGLRLRLEREAQDRRVASHRVIKLKVVKFIKFSNEKASSNLVF